MNDINQNLQELLGKVGLIVHLSQMVEYNLANILSADELLRGFDTDNSMRIVDYNELVQKSNARIWGLSSIKLPNEVKPAARQAHSCTALLI